VGEKISRFRHSELARLCSATERQVQADLRTLTAEGLLSFSEAEVRVSNDPHPETGRLLSLIRSPTRPVPVPRSVLRFLAGGTRPSVAQTMIAYMLRGLSLRKTGAEVSGKGSAKLSWVSKVTGLSERGARYARKELIRLEWIAKDSGSTQWKLNRDGAYFSINLEWTDNISFCPDSPKATFAPRTSGTCPDFAPLNKDRKTPYGCKNQETQETEPKRSGVCEQEGRDIPSPTLSSVIAEDLRRFDRLESLYFQAVDRRWVDSSEATALNFIAAAVRAREVGHDPTRLFVALVRQRLWSHVTQAQEEYARTTLSRFRAERPDRFRISPRAHQMERGPLPPNLRQAIHRGGMPPKELPSPVYSTGQTA